MTTSERNSLRRDLQNPADLFTLIAENNPEGLSNQFQTWGYTYGSSSPAQMVTELMKMWNAGGDQQEKALKLVGGVQYRFGVLPNWMDEVITGQNSPQLRSTTGTGEDQAWFADMDWSGIIDSIFGGVAQVTGNEGGGAGVGEPPVNPYPSTGEAPTNTNAIQWVAVGGAILIIVVALFIALRRS